MKIELKFTSLIITFLENGLLESNDEQSLSTDIEKDLEEVKDPELMHRKMLLMHFSSYMIAFKV